MIKIALKHFIYDKCISILFDFINMNFPIHKVKKYTIDMFHKGDLYDYMVVALHDDIIAFLYDCRITNRFPTYNLIEITYRRRAEYYKIGNITREYRPSRSDRICATCFRPEQIIRTS